MLEIGIIDSSEFNEIQTLINTLFEKIRPGLKKAGTVQLFKIETTLVPEVVTLYKDIFKLCKREFRDFTFPEVIFESDEFGFMSRWFFNPFYNRAIALKQALWSNRSWKERAVGITGLGAGTIVAAAAYYYLYPKPGK